MEGIHRGPTHQNSAIHWVMTDPRYKSYIMATSNSYFPLLTCEVKWGTAALDIADRQNSHCMMLAVRAVIELFRYVKCEGALDREILTFSSRTTTDRWGSTITVL
ncbi:hypothetical protein M433DRAFT_544062 [Acidomyces richmondensis BFW]|nr:hypothetical protein M433DRAFT_544062 [Acidomyces richmondensis BFW]